jgi:signal transduction histidine kinase
MVVIALVAQSDARARVVTDLDPALLRVERLRSSLVDQESGIRGFALSNDPSFLAPYVEGKASETRLIGEIKQLIDNAGVPLMGELDGVEATSERWRSQIAQPILDAGGDDRAAIQAIVDSSKDRFDDVRSALTSAEESISRERDAAQDALTNSTRVLTSAIFVSLGMIGAAGGYATWLLRRRIARPLGDLNDAARRVADGAFDEPLTTEGPAEITELAASVDSMRARIVSDLAAVEATRQELDRYAADLARSNRDLEQFAYVASHDLQEPLRKVASFCQLLEQKYADELDDRGRTYIGFAVDGSRRMQALINGLLQFSRVGRTTEEFEELDLNAAAHQALDNLRTVIEESGATIHLGPLPTLSGDPGLLTALFQNLIGNSLKYRSEAPPEVTVTARREGDMWRIAFTDNGIGIEPRFREQVFVIFQRLHGRDEYGGTGIGLALCKKIVEFHGGAISVDEPAHGAGSTISFTLPAAANRTHDLPKDPDVTDRQREPDPHPTGGG